MSKDILDFLYSHPDELKLYQFLDGKGKLTEALTVAQLKKEIELFSYRLADIDVGNRALLLFPTCREFIIAFFSCLYCGIIPVPVAIPGRRNGLDNLIAIQNDSGASVLIAHRASYQLLEQEIAESPLTSLAVCFVEEYEHLPTLTSRRRLANGIAFLQYTSGSTSSPKGVVVTHENIVANQYMIHERFQTTPETIFLGWTPLHHDMGLIGNVMQPMYIGCQCYLLPPTTLLMRPRVWLSILSDYQITVTGGPNFSYKSIVKRVDAEAVESLKLDLSHLKVLYNGAEPIELDVLDKFCERFAPCGFARKAFLPCYGMAEATLIATGIYADETYSSAVLADEQHMALIHSGANGIQKHENRYVSCGPAVAGGEVRIVAISTRKLLGAYEVGLIELKGPSISPGYWSERDEALTSHNPRWFDTGDIGFMDDKGHLYICGREKDLIIIDGKNHHPQDIEIVINDLNLDVEITEAAVFADGPAVYFVAEVGKKSFRQLSREDITLVKESIGEAVTRKHGVRLAAVNLVRPNTIPKTTSFKVQRQKLKQQFLNNMIEELAVHE